jgi:hypothetical protein
VGVALPSRIDVVIAACLGVHSFLRRQLSYDTRLLQANGDAASISDPA